MMPAKPEKEHEWLQKLVGDWSYSVAFAGGPESCGGGELPTAAETVRSIGGLWVMAEGTGQMPGGGSATMMLTLGYDPKKKKFVGTWYGSMMTYLWVYEGSLDESGKALTLETEGPDCKTEGKTAKYKEVIEFQSDNERTFTSYVSSDGEWQKLMSMTYQRVGEKPEVAHGSEAANQAQGVIPHLVVDGAVAALEFYKRALGATEVIRIPNEDGKTLLHAEMRINNARVYLTDCCLDQAGAKDMKISAPKRLGGTPVTIHLDVPNCDSAVERALAAGATVVMEPWDAFWGARYAQVMDPFGHAWSFAHPLQQTAGAHPPAEAVAAE